MEQLKVGDLAPDAELRDYENNPVKLSDVRGKWTVLVFYPYAFSRICTHELNRYNEDFEKFTAKGARVIGISVDSRHAQRAFAERLGLKDGLTLLSDFPHKRAAIAFGALDENVGAARRMTIVINPEGRIAYLVNNPTTDAREHGDALNAIGG